MTNELENAELIMEKNLILFSDSIEKIHPWRICPLGKHLVKAHDFHILPSKKHPDGSIVTRHQHCAANPSRKDLLSFAEIEEMTRTHFENLTGPPTANILKEFPNADKFDHLIRGWIRYWNDILNPNELLNPNLVKALIATESGFNPNSENVVKKIHARGLMQIVELTRRVVGDHKGELNDHLIHIEVKDLFNPSVNICIGVRWLFRKKEIASNKLQRESSWIEAIAEYKSYLKDMIQDEEFLPRPIEDLQKYYVRLQENEK